MGSEMFVARGLHACFSLTVKHNLAWSGIKYSTRPTATETLADSTAWCFNGTCLPLHTGTRRPEGCDPDSLTHIGLMPTSCRLLFVYILQCMQQKLPENKARFPWCKLCNLTIDQISEWFCWPGFHVRRRVLSNSHQSFVLLTQLYGT